MNSTELMVKYKHDTIGQFRDLKFAIESLNEEDFKNSQKIEIFEAIHEVIERMMNTSKVTLENLK